MYVLVCMYVIIQISFDAYKLMLVLIANFFYSSYSFDTVVAAPQYKISYFNRFKQ